MFIRAITRSVTAMLMVVALAASAGRGAGSGADTAKSDGGAKPAVNQEKGPLALGESGWRVSGDAVEYAVEVTNSDQSKAGVGSTLLVTVKDESGAVVAEDDVTIGYVEPGSTLTVANLAFMDEAVAVGDVEFKLDVSEESGFALSEVASVPGLSLKPAVVTQSEPVLNQTEGFYVTTKIENPNTQEVTGRVMYVVRGSDGAIKWGNMSLFVIPAGGTDERDNDFSGALDDGDKFEVTAVYW